MDFNRWMTKFETFANFTHQLAKLSTCKRAQTGCIIFPPDFSNVVSIGYNGPAAGLSNNRCTGEAGSCGCAHAEGNAIAKIGGPHSCLLMYTMTSPCTYCGNMILNSRAIQAVVYWTPYRDASGINLLHGAGIDIVHVGDLSPEYANKWLIQRR